MCRMKVALTFENKDTARQRQVQGIFPVPLGGWDDLNAPFFRQAVDHLTPQ